MAVSAGRLTGKVALITGAGRGFGPAIALAYAREGARLAVNYLGSEAGAREVVAEAGRLGTEAVPVRGDVAREDDALPPMIERKRGRIINLSTQLAQRPVAGGGVAAYAATKGAIESLTRALASEVGPRTASPSTRSRRAASRPMSRET